MNKQKSFTLIELLVVIVIIGILAGVIMISTSSAIDKANFAKAQAFSSTVQNELLSNLVSEWTFDNASNIGEDTWGNNHGTLYGSAGSQNLPQLQSVSECVFGTCLKFDGTDDYINCGNSNKLNQLTTFTISGWFKLNNNNKHQRLINNADVTAGTPQIGYELVYSPISGEITLYMKGSTTRSLKYLFNDSFSKWVYLVAVYNGLSNKLYENAILKDSNTFSAGDFKNNRTLYIGTRQSLTSQFVDGLIDDVRTYNTALSSSQIKQNYIAGLNSMLASGNISKEDYNERINNLAYNDNNE